MPKALLPVDLLDLNQILVTGGAKQFYAVLAARGYGYANWALGVASSMGLAAIAPADYLRGTALMGICSPIFQILDGTQVDKLRHDIAKSYLRALQRISRVQHGAVVERDIDASEVRSLYIDGLERNGLSIENWNLYFPLAILKRLAGDVPLERFWAFLRDARCAPSPIGVLANLATIAFMYKQTMSGDVRCRQMAVAWLSRNPSMFTCEEIERKLDAALKSVERSPQDEITQFLDLLDLEAHGLAPSAPCDDRARQGWKRHALELARGVGSGAARELDADPDSAAVYRALLKRLGP